MKIFDNVIQHVIVTFLKDYFQHGSKYLSKKFSKFELSTMLPPLDDFRSRSVNSRIKIDPTSIEDQKIVRRAEVSDRKTLALLRG